MDTTLLLPGKEDALARPDVGLERFLKIDLKTAREVDGVSRDAAAVGFTPPAKEASDDDLVEMEFENNGRRWRQWTTVGQLRSDFARAGAVTVNRDGRQEFTIPYAWEASDKTRFGATEIALKALKVFGIDIDIKGKVIDKIADPTAKRAAASVAAYFESQIEKYHPFGLYRFEKLPEVGEQITSPAQLSAAEPLLLFLHGTASSSAGSFGKLAGKPEWDALRKAYAGRILALEHRTFSVTPIQNALDAAQLLPDGARLHLVSHSRGGLVGEMLCLGQAGASRANFDALTERFAGGKDASLAAEREAQRQQLKQLWELLEKKKIRVERFVRVACPARGTTLASKRMDVLASAVINAVGFIPGIKENPLAEFTYDLAKATLLALVKQKADPRSLPGIEAMVPDSPIIEFLNDAALATQADLAVIAGDIEVGNLKSTIPALIGNSFFWAQNDLVVNTRSMSEGMRREGGAVCYFDQGADVSHFNYFINDDTRRMLQRWLMRGESDRIGEFKPIVRETRVARDGRVEEWLEAEARPVEAFESYTLRVSVSHGDLRNSKYPVAVGHYDGDGIVSAEKYIDYQLGGRLSKRAGMKLYPGPIGTAEVIMGGEAAAPAGALIIGLGEMNQLSPEAVRTGVTTAALRYAAHVYENAPDDGVQSAGFSSLLIGTYGGNALRIKDAVSAVLQGAMQANRVLQEQKLWDRVRIDHIELVEIYEDCAIEAIHAAHRISADPPLDFADKVTIEVGPRELVSIGGGRYQRPPSDYETYWWSRIQVTATKDRKDRQDGLEFLLLTDRARAEASTQGTQRQLVDQMVTRAIDQTRYEPKLSSALFELLIRAGEQRTPLTAGDLRFYADVAKADPHPGMLGGILSLALADSNPRWEFANEEAIAVSHFNRAAAWRLFTVYRQEQPTSPQMAGMYLDLIRLYSTSNEPGVAAELLAEFGRRYADAPQFAEVATALADSYLHLGKHDEERAIRQQIMDAAGRRRRSGARLVPVASAGGMEPTAVSPTIIAPPQEQSEGEDPAPAPGRRLLAPPRQGPPPEIDPDYLPALNRLVASLARERRTADILALYSREIAKYPDEQGLYEQRLQWLGQTSLIDEQLRVYQEAIRRFPTNLWTDRLARWYLRQGRRQEFEKYAHEVVERLDDAQAEEFIRKFAGAGAGATATAFEAGLYESLHRVALRRFPHNLRFAEGLLRFYANRRQWEPWRALAAEYYFESKPIREQYLEQLAAEGRLREQAAIARGRDSAIYRLFRADAAIRLANFEEAVADYRELCRRYPNRPDFAERLVALTRSFGQKDAAALDEAAGIQQALADQHPSFEGYRTTAGELQAERGDYRQARAQWERLLQLGVGEKEVYLNAATVYWDYFQYDDALRVLRALRRQKRDESLYAFQMGALLEAKRETGAAIAEYVKELDEGAENHARAVRRLSTLCGRNGVPAIIDAAVRRELARAGDRASLTLGYAAFLDEAGRWTEAAALLRRAASRG